MLYVNPLIEKHQAYFSQTEGKEARKVSAPRQAASKLQYQTEIPTALQL